MNSFNDRVAEKENSLKDVIMDIIGSFQNVNSFLTHHTYSKKPSLAAEGHTKLSSVGLLRSDGGFCTTCGNARRSQQKN